MVREISAIYRSLISLINFFSMKEALEKDEVETKNIPYMKIYPKTFFPEFRKFF
jgi:hypothetical protein